MAASSGKPVFPEDFDVLLTEAARNGVASFRIDARSFADVLVEAHHDAAGGKVVIDVLRGYRPDHPGAEMEDFEQWVGNSVRELTERFSPAPQIVFLYGGQSFDGLFPLQSRGLAGASDRTAVMISAGHGVYFHHEYRDWRAQRDPSNGVVEDEITPLLAAELSELMTSRSKAAVLRARATDEGTHEGSSQAWWKLGARYSLQRDIPDAADIWNSLPESTHALRERDEDIRSRPLYANRENVGTLVHLHTNASDSSAATGARAFIAPGRQEDRSLASSILCYMKELITSQSLYTGYFVPAEPGEANHGENRLAQMPSVIVEAAFHTNPNDALALQDPVFREASMKGVEKGYRLWREGKGCNPLKVDPIATIRVAAGQSRVVDLAFAGFPQYPVVIETKNVACPPGWKCTDGAVTLADADTKPAQITLRCENAGSAPIFWNTRMVDDDGVKSPPVRHIVQCVRGSGMDVSQAVYQDDEGAATARRLP